MPDQAIEIVQEGLLLSKLKDILLKEDREALRNLQATMDDPVLLSDKVMPIIEQRLDFIKNNFPKEFKNAVNEIVDKRLQESQEELLDVIYPTLGKMIKKYISHQFQLFKESLDDRLRRTFSAKGLFWRIRTALFGIPDSEALLQSLDNYIIEEIYIIQRGSGLLSGSASLQQTIDKDVIAGMLTAIKAFVEDAFQRESEELELIQYGTYKILIQNFYSYYIAVAMSGTLSAQEEEELSSKLLDFAENKIKSKLIKQADEHSSFMISEQLHEHFIKPQEALLKKDLYYGK